MNKLWNFCVNFVITFPLQFQDNLYSFLTAIHSKTPSENRRGFVLGGELIGIAGFARMQLCHKSETCNKPQRKNHFLSAGRKRHRLEVEPMAFLCKVKYFAYAKSEVMIFDHSEVFELRSNVK